MVVILEVMPLLSEAIHSVTIMFAPGKSVIRASGGASARRVCSAFHVERALRRAPSHASGACHVRTRCSPTLVLDTLIIPGTMSRMAGPQTIAAGSDPQVLADLDAVMQRLATGKPLDPAASRRIRERAERITEEIRRQHGELDIAVQLIRETRDEA